MTHLIQGLKKHPQILLMQPGLSISLKGKLGLELHPSLHVGCCFHSLSEILDPPMQTDYNSYEPSHSDTVHMPEFCTMLEDDD